ncbi:ABC transporter permease [Ornithinimicrobium cryptoxanthini]|uniref:ABC transporter permease n=1 Tax=Ornithinimicrobium cryptoxanthini TaxID=2934161 RepID=A0ABY4YLD9_9MICO|nr:ABC transporter permease [Ornithinimicrobium cryptoxanthini]USQ77376.1 ABC transporter permease [Ornithinimicrobium cryptoxanthini]
MSTAERDVPPQPEGTAYDQVVLVPDEGPRGWRRTALELLRRPVAVVSMLVLLGVLALALFGDLVAPYGVNEVNLSARLQPPSADFWFGTDELGRDILSRVIASAAVSVRVSLIAVSIALVVGVTVGLLAGFFGGWLDALIMRTQDVLFAFPEILLAMAIVAILGPGVTTATIAIGVVYIPVFARVTRASTLSVRTETYVRASKSLGAGPWRQMTSHVLPNISAPIIVQTSLSLSFAILSEASLSFLGLGVQPPEPSWGRMLFDSRAFFQDAWWMSVFPGLAVFVTVLACNLLGDILRDVLDVRSAATARGGTR